jgi:4-amino-4-deoxy-L-arabinose transferase-like glycosyltransferase
MQRLSNATMTGPAILISRSSAPTAGALQTIRTAQPDRPGGFWKHPLLHCILLSATFFAAIAPTLTWQEFTGGMENFNVATAIETVRDGHWLLPYLQGEPRTKKPPLTQWITALGLMSSQSRPWGARWPSLVMASLTLPAVYELGRIIGGRRLALLSAVICGSSFLFLKFAHMASYDVQLTLWVTLCNLGIALAIFRERWAIGFTIAGISLGLALLTKVPVAILQTVAPVLAWRGWQRRKNREPRFRTDGQEIAIAAFAAIAVALAISLPWTIWVMRKLPGLPTQWMGEVTLSVESKFEQRFGWHSYLVLIPEMFPWLLWFGAGLWLAFKAKVLNSRIQVVFFWLLAPIVAMTFFPERRDRYLLPMIGPAAIVSAWAMLRLLGPIHNRAAGAGQTLINLQWGMLALLAVGLPLAGATYFRGAGGGHWFSLAFAAVGAIIGLWLMFCGSRLGRRSWKALVAASFAIMLLAHGLHLYGYAQSREGRSEAKVFVQRILKRYPNARFVNANHRGVPLEFSIYLDRVVPTADDPTTLDVDWRPLVVLNREQQMPTPPNGFALANSMIINKERWNAYVRMGR